MQPSPYDRTMTVLRTRFRRRPVAMTAVVLAFVWICLNVYETVSLGDRFGLGWFDTVRGVVSVSGVGIVALAGLVWLIERTFGDSPR
jgi:hypothetical protein